MRVETEKDQREVQYRGMSYLYFPWGSRFSGRQLFDYSKERISMLSMSLINRFSPSPCLPLPFPIQSPSSNYSDILKMLVSFGDD